MIYVVWLRNIYSKWGLNLNWNFIRNINTNIYWYRNVVRHINRNNLLNWNIHFNWIWFIDWNIDDHFHRNWHIYRNRNTNIYLIWSFDIIRDCFFDFIRYINININGDLDCHFM